MEIFKHYKHGTSYIDCSGESHGYSPSRNELILSVLINIDEYSIHINPYGISVRYKYIHVYQSHFKIGRWRYHAAALRSSFYEKKRVLHMYDVLNELLNELRIGGEVINDWAVIKVIESHVR